MTSIPFAFGLSDQMLDDGMATDAVGTRDKCNFFRKRDHCDK